MNDPKTIEEFLEMLKEAKWKNRFEDVTSTLDPQARYVLVYLSAAAGEEGASIEDLKRKLTEENSEWLAAKLNDSLSKFKPDDTRGDYTTAANLVKEPLEARHTLEWVVKAERARHALSRLALFDGLTEALVPFKDSQEDFVNVARNLLVDFSGNWSKKVHEALKTLQDKKPKDVASDAEWYLKRLTLERAGYETSGHIIFYTAREVIEGFEPTTEWISKAQKSLVDVRVEKARKEAHRVFTHWNKYLPVGQDHKLVDDLKKALDERDLMAMLDGVEALKGFKPTCTEPDCHKSVQRENGGNGQYALKCKKHQAPVLEMPALVVPAPEVAADVASGPDLEQRKLLLKKVLEKGEPVPTMEVEVGPADRTVKGDGKRTRRDRGQRNKK